jgi:hypothetical protein
MKKSPSMIALILLLTLVLSACVNKSPQTYNVTPLAPRTVKATSTIPQSVITTDPNHSIATPTLLRSSPTKVVTQLYQDLGYYDGIIVITQYYTLSSHGLYEEAYSLLSSSAPHHKSLEEYLENSKAMNINKIKIVTIQPLYLNVEKQGGWYGLPDSLDRKRFYVQIIAWGEERMAGAVLSGELQELFVTLVKENNEWKIFSSDTAP